MNPSIVLAMCEIGFVGFIGIGFALEPDGTIGGMSLESVSNKSYTPFYYIPQQERNGKHFRLLPQVDGFVPNVLVRHTAVLVLASDEYERPNSYSLKSAKRDYIVINNSFHILTLNLFVKLPV